MCEVLREPHDSAHELFEGDGALLLTELLHELIRCLVSLIGEEKKKKKNFSQQIISVTFHSHLCTYDDQLHHSFLPAEWRAQLDAHVMKLFCT